MGLRSVFPFLRSANPDKLFYEPTPREVTSKMVNETQVGPVINYVFTVSVRRKKWADVRLYFTVKTNYFLGIKEFP